MLRFGCFQPFLNLYYGISTLKDGTMDVATGNPERDELGAQNRKKFFAQKNIVGPIFSPCLIHGNTVCAVHGQNWNETVEADAAITREQNICLTVTGGDCFPVYCYDSETETIGLAHAGWKGIVRGVIANTIQVMAKQFSSQPENIRIGIGPGICKRHYTIPQEHFGYFRGYEHFIEMRRGQYFTDLEGMIGLQARMAGARLIESSGQCTYCLNTTYFSHRRERRALPRVMLAYVLLKKHGEKSETI